MKQKISPTSVKNNSPQTDDIAEKFSNADPVHAPSRRASGWYPSIILSVLIGFLAGIVGTFVIFRWGADIGLENLIFSGTEQGIRYVRSPSSDEEARLREYSQAIKEIAPALIPLYVQGSEAHALSGVYPPEALTGWGTMLSQDGVGVTVTEAVGTQTIVARADDGSFQPLKILFSDKQTGAVFFSFERNGGPIADLVDPKGVVMPGDQVLSLRGPLSGQDAVIREHVVVSTSGIVGRPDMLSHSSEETLSALHVTVNGDDAPGTPIVERSGRIIGLLRKSSSDGIEALQSSEIIRLLPAVLAKTVSDPPYLGVSYLNLSEDPSFSTALKTDMKAGAYIYNQQGSPVEGNSPAEKAGILPGDIVTKVGDKLLEADYLLTDAIAGHSPGDLIHITLIRKGAERSVDVTLGARH